MRIAALPAHPLHGWPTVHAPFGSPAKFGDPVVGLLAIRSGEVGALEGSLTDSPLLSGRELWQWYTNELGDPMLVESETTRAPHASTGWRHLYTGRPWDAQTRSYYYRHRWYDPHQARFLSRDPIGYDDGLLQYAYVGGNPISFVDPLGLKNVPIEFKDGSTFCFEVDDQMPAEQIERLKRVFREFSKLRELYNNLRNCRDIIEKPVRFRYVKGENALGGDADAEFNKDTEDPIVSFDDSASDPPEGDDGIPPRPMKAPIKPEDWRQYIKDAWFGGVLYHELVHVDQMRRGVRPESPDGEIEAARRQFDEFINDLPPGVRPPVREAWRDWYENFIKRQQERKKP